MQSLILDVFRILIDFDRGRIPDNNNSFFHLLNND